jgi:hypothetical protein
MNCAAHAKPWLLFRSNGMFVMDRLNECAIEPVGRFIEEVSVHCHGLRPDYCRTFGDNPATRCPIGSNAADA